MPITRWNKNAFSNILEIVEYGNWTVMETDKRYRGRGTSAAAVKTNIIFRLDRTTTRYNKLSLLGFTPYYYDTKNLVWKKNYLHKYIISSTVIIMPFDSMWKLSFFIFSHCLKFNLRFFICFYHVYLKILRIYYLDFFTSVHENNTHHIVLKPILCFALNYLRL